MWPGHTPPALSFVLSWDYPGPECARVGDEGLYDFLHGNSVD